MRVIASGIADLSLLDFVELGENAHEISENLRRKILLADSFNNLQPLLKELHDFSRNGEKPSVSKLVLAILATPRVLEDLEKARCDLLLEAGTDLSETLAGEKFNELFNHILKPVIKGSSREEVYNSRIARLLPASSSITILDRFFVSQLTKNEYKATGAYWLLSKFVESGTRNIEILSSKNDSESKDGQVNLDILKNRLTEIVNSVNFKVCVYGKVGFSPHDRHITFRFSHGVEDQTITLGGGGDVFKYETLGQAYALVPLESETASDNEKHILDSKGLDFEVKNY